MTPTLPASSLPQLTKRLATQPICIFGLAREGLSAYHFIRTLLPEHPLWLADDRPSSKLDPHWSELLQKDAHVQLITPEKTQLPSSEVLLIKSPGIPPFHPVLQQIQQFAVGTTSNTQLFFDAIAELPQKVITIGVTGTKGKSTTTALIHHVLKANGLHAVLGGNIGVPPLDMLSEIVAVSSDTNGVLATTPEDQSTYAVLEMSSHQLRDVTTSPHIAVIQNIVPEHMDYYSSFMEYVEAKANITVYQSIDDYVIFNPGYQSISHLADFSPSQKLPFSTPNTPQMSESDTPPVAQVTETSIEYQGEVVLSRSDIPLSGLHNLENVMPAVIVGKLQQLSSSQITQAIKSFKGLEHRLEKVAEVNGVAFYNDSLSTVQDAAVAALQAFADRPVILIAGGYDRGLDFSLLAQQLTQQTIKGLLLFSPTGPKIAAAYEAANAEKADKKTTDNSIIRHILYPKTMSEAVTEAFALAEPGDVVLLSPASPSFGQFKDYRDRGEQFKKAVSSLEK